VPGRAADARDSAATAAGQAVNSKISKRLLWFIFLLFVFSFLDRINIGFAGLTMMKDLGLTSTQFGLAIRQVVATASSPSRPRCTRR
jgi:ACS family 4-hydroxyphenylacetate permease-like MFS transporter